MHLEDLKIGDWITILSWKPAEFFNPMTGDIKVAQTKNFVGDPLRIVAIDPPFLAVEIQASKVCASLDSRAASLMKLSKKYVDALSPNFKLSGHQHMGETF